MAMSYGVHPTSSMFCILVHRNFLLRIVSYEVHSMNAVYEVYSL